MDSRGKSTAGRLHEKISEPKLDCGCAKGIVDEIG